jgi:hypothetical protein
MPPLQAEIMAWQVVRKVVGTAGSRITLEILRPRDMIGTMPAPLVMEPYEHMDVTLPRLPPAGEPEAKIAGLGILFHKVAQRSLPSFSSAVTSRWFLSPWPCVGQFQRWLPRTPNEICRIGSKGPQSPLLPTQLDVGFSRPVPWAVVISAWVSLCPACCQRSGRSSGLQLWPKLAITVRVA